MPKPSRVITRQTLTRAACNGALQATAYDLGFLGDTHDGTYDVDFSSASTYDLAGAGASQQDEATYDLTGASEIMTQPPAGDAGEAMYDLEFGAAVDDGEADC